MIRVLVLTVSDSCAQGRREDVSGRTIEEMLPRERFAVRGRVIVPDDRDAIEAALSRAADEGEIDLVLTTGGTGLGPRDVTPEATAAVCDRLVPGLGELMRSEGFRKTPYAVLSRGLAGIQKNTLVVNLPGSPRAVRESLEVIMAVLPHAVEMLHGGGHEK
jgi:molybdenum cofactor synthesis domain-containing protein